MPDKRYSLKVNGKNRTVKADVFNDNIGKFINDMPDATIMMQGQDGTTREYKLREIADAYDAGYSFLETDTPIYVNSKPPQQKPAAAPQPKPTGEAAGTVTVTQEAAQVQQSQQQATQMQQATAQQPAQPTPDKPYVGQTVNAENGYTFTEAGLDSLEKGATPVAVPAPQEPAKPPFFTAENPSPLQPKEEEKISLTPFADKMKEIRQMSESPDLNKQWAERQRESERRMTETGTHGFAYTAEGMKLAEEADAARRLNRSKYDEQHFDDFYDKKVAPIFGEERTAGTARARQESDALPVSPMPGAVGGLFGKAVAYERHTDPQKIADATIGRVQKDDSFGDYVMARMGIDPKSESTDGATVPQLSEREKEWINRLFAKESGEVAEQIQQRIYDQYQRENAPQGTLDYIMGKAFHENLAATLGDAIVRRAAHSSGMREQLRAMASDAYGREQSWGVRVAGGAAPFAVDMVAGGFALPNLVGEAVVKGGVGMAARQVTQQMAKRAAARGLEGAALKEATSGAAGVAERYLATQAPIVNLAVRTAGSAANFATYDLQAEVVRQIGEGEFKPFDLLKEAVHGAVLGGAMGVAGGTIGHLTRNASRAGKVMGGVAGLGAETTIFGVSNGLAKAQADGEDISNVDWADTMGEAFGQVVGMKAVGVAMHPRQFLNRYRKSKDYDLQLNQRDIDELREAGYDFGSIIKGLGTFGDTAPMEANVVSRAKEYTAGPDGTGRKRETTSEEAWVDAEAYEAIMRNPEVSSSTKRKLAYIATGKVLMPEPVFGVQMNVGDDGKATVTTLNAYGQPIETKDYDSEDAARKDYGELQSVSKRNTIDGLERIAARAGFPDLVDGARQRTMNETGSDVDEVLTSEQRDREAADAILDNYIKNLQEAYMQRFNEKLRQLGGREGGDRGEEPQPAGEAAGEGAGSTPPPTGEGVNNASGEAGAASGTAADNPPAPPANPPSSAGTADSETMSRRDAAYDRGASVKDDSSILPAINYEVKLADARLAALFPDGDGNLSRLRKAVMDAVESGDDDTADKVIEAAKGRLTAQQLEALEQYRDLMETQRGVEDAVTTQTEAFEEQRRAELQAVAASDGTVTPIELQDGRTAYYKAGDLRNKYGGIVVAHEDGTTEQIPTSAVRSIGESQKVDDIVNADIEEYANDIREGYEGLANGTIFHPGATVDFVIGGKMVRATVAGQDAAGNPVFTLDDGSQMPMMQADARRAIAEADKIKIQAQLQQEREVAVAQQQTERYKKGIVGFAEGKPDYAAEGSDPQVVAEYLKSMSQDPSNNGPILKNIEGEEALIMQNAQQAYDEWQRAENAIEMSDDDLRKKAKAIQDRQGAVQRLVELERQRRKWGEIRQAIMTPEERLKYEGARQGNYNKALAAVKKYRETNPREPAGETTGTTAQPIPTAQELFSQHQEQSDAMNAVTALRKEAAREWNNELQPELQKVRGAISDYQRGLTEYDEEGLKELADAQTELEEREQALLARNRELKNLEKTLGRMYASRDNAELTPHERKMNQLGREKDRVKKMQLAKQAFVDDPIAAEILENDEPTDVYEFVARNLGYGSLNWEGLERGEHHVRGVQEMMGRDKTRSLEKGSDTYGFNAYLAPTGEGMGFDEAVHSIYESQPDREDGTKAYSTEDIANALEDMLRTATRPTDISHRIENDRIAQAEQVYRANEEREREEAAEAEAEYMEYLETLRGLIPTEEAENYISGLMADEIAEIEADREAYREAMRQMMPDEQEPAREPADAAANNQNNIQDGETANQPQPAVTGSGRVDKQPQPAAVESGVGEGQTPVQGTEANQPASETGRTEQPTTQPAGARKGTGSAHADQGAPVPPESAGDLEAPKELADRISISEDYTEGEGENGKIYLTPVTIDGTYEVVKVDEPDAKGNYSGSYYEYEGKRFGDLNEVVRHIDGVTKPKDETKGESLMHVPFSERLKAAKGETDTNPTEAQKAAGNYKMGHIQFGGYRMSIENPKGSVRSGRDANGNPWSITMQDTYGYIGRKYGADGDHLDFFINDDADLDNWSGRVYVVDQKNLDGTFDEHKVMYGYPNWAAAKKAYERNYEPGWWDSRVMQMMGVPKERFDKWLADSDHKTKPYAEYFRLKYDNPVSDPVSDMLATVQERKEAGEKASAPFGPVYDQFKGKAKDAVDFLRKEKTGVAKGALYHKQVGDIDVAWGDEHGGLAHIDSKHPGIADNLQEVLDGMSVVSTSANRIVLDSPTHRMVVSKDWNGKPVDNWLLTAYGKKNGASGGSIDIVPEPEGKQNGKSTLQSTVSEGKGTNNIPNKQGKTEKSLTEAKPAETPLGSHGTLVIGGVPKTEKPASIDDRLPSDEEITQRNALVDIMRNAGIDVSLKFSEGRQVIEEVANGDYRGAGITFQKVTDKDTLKQLDEGSTVKRLRAMQMVDGKLYPPMSGKVDGQWREPTEIGVWEQSEERPDLLDKNGKFVLKKGLKGEGRGDTPAAYNPYFHTSTSGLNDQFTAAYKRPELVVVEVEIPESELTSGYQAQGAKDHVGDIPWHSGPVNGALPNDRKRTVTLSRWSKVVRVVPDGEVADMVAKQLEGTGVEVPYNVVTPSLRKELEARGVKISSTPAGTVTEDINGNPIKKSGKTKFFRTKSGEVYGFVKDGKIYIDPLIADSESPIHEYSHLWWAALQRENPEECKNVVEVMKQCKDVWEEVKRDNPELATDEDIADEVLARYSGRRGRAKLAAIRKQIVNDGDRPASDKEKALGAIDKLKNILNEVWKMVADFLHIHYKTPEQVADQVMRDMLNGVNPNEARMKKEPDAPKEPAGEAAGSTAEPASEGEAEAAPKGYSIEPRFHAKKGINIYAVKFEEKFDREKFLDLKKQVKEFGGYYSSFGKGGFIFEGSADDARKFAESVTKTIEHEQENEEQQRAADTAALVREVEAVASEAEHVAADVAEKPQGAVSHEAISKAVEKVDTALEKIDKQLALLGYYEGGDDVPFHESYGYAKSAEKKALKDANDLARKIGAAIGFDVGRKQIAKANIAPIGGDITITIPFMEGRQLYVDVMLDVDGDNLRMRHGYYRVEYTGDVPQGRSRYGDNNHFDAEETLDSLIEGIKRAIRYGAPEYEIRQIAQKGASKAKKPNGKATGATAQMGDLFAQQMEDTASKEAMLEQAKGFVKEFLDWNREITSDQQRDTLQQWVDEAMDAVPMTERSVKLDKAMTKAINAIREYEQKKADQYKAEVEPAKQLFPKNGEAKMRDCEQAAKEAWMSNDSRTLRQKAGELQELFIQKMTDEGVGLMEQMERWKAYYDGLVAEWRAERAATQPQPAKQQHEFKQGDKAVLHNKFAVTVKGVPFKDGKDTKINIDLNGNNVTVNTWELTPAGEAAGTTAKPSMRPATEADLDARTEVYHEGKPTQVAVVSRHDDMNGEPTISSILLTNGKKVKLEDLQVKEEKTPAESDNEAEKDVSLQTENEPIKNENNEREGTTGNEGASDAPAVGVDASDSDGGLQPGGTGGTVSSGNAGAEATRNPRRNVRRGKRVVEAGSLFDAGDFGDTEEQATGGIRVQQPAGGSRNDGGRNGDGRGRQDGGAGTEKPQEVAKPAEPKGEKPAGEAAGTPAKLTEPAKREDDGSVKTSTEKAAPLNTRNYLYPKDASDVDNMSPRERLRANVRALEILRDLLHEGRDATAAERAELGKFRGWGGIDTSRWYDLDYMRRLSKDRYTPSGEELSRLADVIGELDPDGKRDLLGGIRGAGLTSYYTPTAVGRSINKFFELAGYTGGGTFIDGSMGSGVLEGTMPKGMQQRTQIYGTELDWLTGQIAKQLYPDANVKIQGFQDLDMADGSFDLAGSNIPFGDIKIHDKSWKNTSDPVKRAAQGRIHNYFVVKKIDLVKPGGLLYIMTSNAVMDTKSNQLIRQYMVDQCEILGAMRLPDNTFKGAGTKVVTDVIFMRKYRDGGDAAQTRQGDYLENIEKPFLSHTTMEAAGRYQTYNVPLNGYYAAHPDMMIGTVKAGGQYRDDEFGLTSDLTTEDIAKKMDSLLKKHIVPSDRQGKLYDTHKTVRQVHEAIRESYKGDGSYISSGNLVEQNGKYGVVTITKGNADFQEIPGLKSSGAKIRLLMPLRRAMKELIAEEIGGASDAHLSGMRKTLQQAYDAYVKKFGRLQDKGSKYIADDIDGYTLMSLEKWKDGKFEGLSDIFTKSTIKPRLKVEVTKDTKPTELVTLSLAEYGEVRESFMRQHLGDNWLELCGDSLFELPIRGGYQVRDLYLSGDVKSKLEDAERAAKDNPKFQKNVDALKSVLPKDIPFVGISIHMGARWVPEHVYTDFLCDLLGISESNPKSGITYMPEADQFQVYISANEPSGKIKDYETDHRDATALIEAALKNNKVKISTTDRDGNEIFLEDETNSANDKIQDIREKFEDFLSKDRDRVQELEQLYNDKFNRTVIPHYDGSHLQIPGLQGMELRPHQKDAVWMLINNRGGIIDHIVGAGKTLVMQASIMEMRRMGIAKKPMIIALKATVPQMAAEFRQAFPTARILAPSEAEFTKSKRKQLLSKIALNDWDCVILSHEQYCMLPHTEEIETGVFREQLDQLDAAISLLHGDTSQMTKKQLKGLEKRKKNLEAKIQKLLDRKVDREFTFENLGVDYLYVDECQQFKSLPYVTTKQNVAGLASPEGSQRAVSLLCGARYLQQLHQGDMGITLLSGTTISNSLVELYSLFQYVRPNKMRELGFNTFDAWAANFAECNTELEYNHVNELVMRSRFRSFDNVPELAKLYTEVADVRNDLNLKLPKPKMRVHEVIVPASPALEKIAEECAVMCKTKSGKYFGIPDKTDSGKDQPWALLATNISTKAAISVKLVDTSLDDGEGGKIRYVCDNVKQIYDKFKEQKGTQMIFCDLGVPGPDKSYDVYNDIIKRLSEDYGIPRDEIVDIHVANTDAKKKALFKKVNDGDVRVLIAGAKNGGTGVNVQKRLIAVHHVDMSWNPANITQENGRAERQGNWIAKEFNDDKVEIYYYATEKSLDLYKYQLVTSKQAMIDKFKTGASADERSFDEGEASDDSGFNPASIVALLSGNPIIMEKAKHDKKVEKLIKSKRQYMVEHEQRVYDYQNDQRTLKNFELLVERNKQDRAVLEQHGFKPDEKGVYPATVTVYSDKDPKKKTFDKPGEAGKRMKYLVNSGDKVILEAYGMTAEIGFPEETTTGEMVRVVRLKAPSGISYSVNFSNDDTAAGVSMRRLLKQVIDNGEAYAKAVERAKHRLEGGDPGEAKFPKEEELKAALEEKKRIDAEYAKLSAEKQGTPDGETPDAGGKMQRRGERAAAMPQPTKQQMQEWRTEAIKTAEELGGTEIHFDQRSHEPGEKGYFDTGDNSIHVNVDEIESTADLKRTILHEKLGHEGLKALFGSNAGVNQWGQFLFGSANRKIRQRIMERAEREGYGWDDPLRFSKAAQEVFADIAEAGPRNADEFSLWRKVKHHLIEQCNKRGLRIPGLLNDHDLRYYVLKTGEALKKWDGMSTEAQQEAGSRMYSRAGKPRKRKDESMAQYLQRLRAWEKWKIAEEESRANGDPQPDKEAIDKRYDEQYKADVAAWRQANGLPAGEADGTNGPGAFPKREAGESPQEYALRVAEYETMSDVWKTAPDWFDYQQRAQEEYRDAYEAWKARYNLVEAENVDMDLYEGTTVEEPTTDADIEAETRMEEDLAEAVGVAVDSDGARRHAKLAVIERRKNLESSNAEDAIWLYDLRKKIDAAAKAMSERTGEQVTGKELREALPFIIEGTYFEDILRDDKGDVVSIEDISDQLPIKKGPELDALLDEIKTWYDNFYHALEDAGLRYDAGYIAEGYVNHVWDKKRSDPKAWESVIENYQRTKSPNMRHREIDTYREGMDIGLVPKYSDICDILAHYSRQNNEALANKKFLDDLSFMMVEEVNGDGEVVANWPLMNSRKPAFGDDKYVMYHVPGVGDVWVLKDIQRRFASIFGTMRTPDVADWLSKLGKGYDLTGSTMKKIQLSISGFHMGALTEVAMAQMRPDRAMKALFEYIIYDSFIKQGTLPAYAHPEDFKFAASHLVQLGATEDYAAADVNAITATFRKKVKEWYDAENAGKKVAGAAATPLAFALDMINKGMDAVLWNYLHDGLKIACFKMFAEQIDQRVKKEGLSDEQREQLLDEAGQYVNDTFGGQYWELLNVSPALLKWMRRAFLSPDWLLSTQRHFFANFGFGSLYSESGFLNYLRYNADNIRRAFGANIPRDELRRFRSKNAKQCYILGVCGFFYTMMNALNAVFRAQDEEEEKEKAEEIRKQFPDYQSPYELAYPDGMKWYDYTMLGNSLGQQTHLFMGRYQDGTETYVRWGKQFREFPEMFMGRKGVEFPTPLIERMMGKANPMIGLTRDNLGALGVWGFNNSKDIEEIQEKYGKEVGVLAMNARHFLPFSVPTQADKEFKAMDLLMPSQKGFTRYKTVDFFKTFILAGDMEGVTRTYNAAVMNGIDAEKCLRAAISTIKATQRKEMQDGVINLQTAMEKFDEADNGYSEKAALRNKIIGYLAESNYHTFTREDAQEKIDAFLQGDGVAEKDSERYIELCRSDDVRDDYRLSVIAKQAKGYVDKVKTCDNPQEQSQMSRMYGAWFEINGIANKARYSMNQLKKQLGRGHDAQVMEQIRHIRQQAQTEIDHVQPPR